MSRVPFGTVLIGFFFQAEDGIRDRDVTGVQTCALPILSASLRMFMVEDSATRRRRILRRESASRIKLAPNSLPVAGLASSTTALKTAGFRQKSARTIPSNSISLMETAVAEQPQFPRKSPPPMWAVLLLQLTGTLRPLSPAFHATRSVHFRSSHPGCRYVESNSTTRLLTL